MMKLSNLRKTLGLLLQKRQSKIVNNEMIALSKIEPFIPPNLISVLYKSCISRPSILKFISRFFITLFISQAVIAFLLPPLFAVILSCFFTIGLWYALIVQSKTMWHRAFDKKFPTALNIVINAVYGGIPLELALNLASKEIGNPIREVFDHIVFQLKIGVPLDQILEEEKRKIDNFDFSLFCSALSIGHRTGGKTSNLLNRLREVMDMREKVHMKSLSLAQEAKSSGAISVIIPIGMVGMLCFVNEKTRNFFFFEKSGYITMGIIVALITTNLIIVKILTRKK